MMHAERNNTVICLFGLPRSLSIVCESIVEEVIAPASQYADIHVLGHFYDKSADPDEPITRYPDEYLELSQMKQEDPLQALDECGFYDIRRYGDFWNDGFISLRNLMLQLHSLKQVTGMALARGADICLFLRPDLFYHDSAAPVLAEVFGGRGDCIWLPGWQRWKGGLNDRLAICRGRGAISAYGNRANSALEYCRRTGEPLHSERFLAYIVSKFGIPVSRLPVRASRVRSNGIQVNEDFSIRQVRYLRQKAKRSIGWQMQRIFNASHQENS